MSLDDVSVSIAVQDARVTQAGFGVPLFVPESSHVIFGERTKEYSDIDSVAADWATDTSVYAAATALFSQTTKSGKKLEKIKVGRVDSGDADLTATLTAIEAEDPEWYCLLLEDRDKADLLLAANWVEARTKIFIGSTDDADIIASGSLDLASVLKAASHSRTALIWNHLSDTTYPACAWAGVCLPEDPGSVTWKFQTLTGITASPIISLSSAERAYAEDKYCNVYVTTSGISHTSEGVMASGRFIDVQRGVDWLDARLEEAVFTTLVNLKKVPYTNAGLAVIESAIRGVMAQALERGVINPLSDVDETVDLDYILTIPNVADISSASRSARLFPDITFRALVGNAVHGVTVSGTLEV